MEDKVLIDGLRSGDVKTIRAIYDQCFPKVRTLIVNNSGSESDAYDVFQEALELILLKMDTFKVNLEGMIILICKRKWIDKLRKKKSKDTFEQSASLQYKIESDAEQKLIDNEKAHLRTQLLEKSFRLLSDTCKRLMLLVKQGVDVQEIIKTMEFASANTMYRRKAACMKRWSEMVKEDKLYSQYFQ